MVVHVLEYASTKIGLNCTILLELTSRVKQFGDLVIFCGLLRVYELKNSYRDKNFDIFFKSHVWISHYTKIYFSELSS